MIRRSSFWKGKIFFKVLENIGTDPTRTSETDNLAFCMCKILLEGQMSEKKWEDALSFKCTLVGEYI
jgi:DNA repair protein RadC